MCAMVCAYGCSATQEGQPLARAVSSSANPLARPTATARGVPALRKRAECPGLPTSDHLTLIRPDQSRTEDGRRKYTIDDEGGPSTIVAHILPSTPLRLTPNRRRHREQRVPPGGATVLCMHMRCTCNAHARCRRTAEGGTAPESRSPARSFSNLSMGEVRGARQRNPPPRPSLPDN